MLKASILIVASVISIIARSSVGTEQTQENGELKKIEDDFVGKKEHDVQVLVEDAIDWAHNIVLLMRTARKSSDVAQFVPFSLFPTPFPRKYFRQAVDVQKALQVLQFRVSLDYKFLEEVHRAVVKGDKVLKKCMDIVREVHEEGPPRQPITVFLQRSDYMLHVNEDEKRGEPKYAIKQIEINTGVVGGADWADEATQLHRRALGHAGMDASTEVVPENRADKTLAEGIYKAWKAFGDPKAIIVLMCYKPYTLQFTLRHLEYELESQARANGTPIKIVRLSIFEAASELKLADDFSLQLENHVVAVVYCGVMPLRWWRERHWKVRLDIERSTAIKSPSMAVKMSGSKKVQQYLSLPGMVERFFPDPEDAPTIAAIRSTYAGLWGLEHNDEKTKARIKDAVQHPDRYVLKPDGGGGGGNIFGKQIPEKLDSFTPAQLGAHILMERLHPYVVKAYMVWPLSKPRFEDKAVSELSIFGCLMGNIRDGSVLHNVQQGHLMRTKPETVDEGGISIGGGVLDTPYLF